MAEELHVEFDSRAVRHVEAAVEWYDGQGVGLVQNPNRLHTRIYLKSLVLQGR